MLANQKKCSDKTKILTSQRIIAHCNSQRILCVYVCVYVVKSRGTEGTCIHKMRKKQRKLPVNHIIPK